MTRDGTAVKKTSKKRLQLSLNSCYKNCKNNLPRLLLADQRREREWKRAVKPPFTDKKFKLFLIIFSPFSLSSQLENSCNFWRPFSVTICYFVPREETRIIQEDIIMYRQSPGRNHRSKGVRIKNVLQICLLLAVCFWLIYQVKHSHDKKKEFDESDAKGALQRSSRLGRKDIQSQGDGTVTMNENHDDPSDEEEAIGEEVDETKHEEDEPEDRKVEAKEDDDEVDEHEEEKSDAEVDREHELDGEDKEDGDENETRETDPEDGRGEIEKESTAEDTDHDGDDKSTREEHYKADDASSAVTHDTQIVTTENENEHLETKADILHDSENSSFPNKTVLEGSNGTLTSNSTIENHDLTSENITESEIQLGHGPGNHTEDNNSVLNVDNTHSDSNSTGSVEFSDSSNNSTVSSSSEDTLISDASMEAGNNNMESSSENNNEVEGENSDPGDDGTDETMETTMIENPEEVQQDAIDESDTSHSMEKDVRTDLDTLPEIQTEGSNNDDAASE